MKKLLCIILSFSLLLGTLVTVSAQQEEPDKGTTIVTYDAKFALSALRYAVEKRDVLTAKDLFCLDAQEDGVINAKDALCILKIAVGKMELEEPQVVTPTEIYDITATDVSMYEIPACEYSHGAVVTVVQDFSEYSRVIPENQALLEKDFFETNTVVVIKVNSENGKQLAVEKIIVKKLQLLVTATWLEESLEKGEDQFLVYAIPKAETVTTGRICYTSLNPIDTPWVSQVSCVTAFDVDSANSSMRVENINKSVAFVESKQEFLTYAKGLKLYSDEKNGRWYSVLLPAVEEYSMDEFYENYVTLFFEVSQGGGVPVYEVEAISDAGEITLKIVKDPSPSTDNAPSGAMISNLVSIVIPRTENMPKIYTLNTDLFA